MNSREAILARIRSEVSRAPEVKRPPVPEVWPRTNPSREAMVERFLAELAAVTGEVVRCGSMEEVPDRLAELFRQSEWSCLGAVDNAVCRTAVAGLAEDQVVWAHDGWDPKAMAELSAGLVSADQLLADTGSCVVSCNTAEERLLCYLPPVSVVLAQAETLAEHLPAAWETIAKQAADAQQRGETVIITGPSRTADIEKILILGVHGPKRLIVLLVD